MILRFFLCVNLFCVYFFDLTIVILLHVCFCSGGAVIIGWLIARERKVSAYVPWRSVVADTYLLFDIFLATLTTDDLVYTWRYILSQEEENQLYDTIIIGFLFVCVWVLDEVGYLHDRKEGEGRAHACTRTMTT